MIFHYTLDDDGQPVAEPDLVKWAIWFDKAERRVSYNDLGSDVKVSTVFLGTDHGYDDTKPPVLWETMVFGGPHDEHTVRYTSKEAAQAGHQAIVVALLSGGELP